MRNQLFRAVLCGACIVMAPSVMAQKSPRTKQEITHLLDAVGNPACKFERNGTWHDPQAAKSHLQDKYHYLAKKHLVSTAEDFIQGAATASSMSGRAYRVRCNGGPAVDSGPWLTDELRRFRGTK